MRKKAEKKRIVKNAEGTMFEVRSLDTVRKAAVLKQVSDLDEINELHGVYAIKVGNKLTKYLSLDDAETQFKHQQEKKVA